MYYLKSKTQDQPTCDAALAPLKLCIRRYINTNIIMIIIIWVTHNSLHLFALYSLIPHFACIRIILAYVNKNYVCIFSQSWARTLDYKSTCVIVVCNEFSLWLHVRMINTGSHIWRHCFCRISQTLSSTIAISTSTNHITVHLQRQIASQNTSYTLLVNFVQNVNKTPNGIEYKTLFTSRTCGVIAESDRFRE